MTGIRIRIETTGLDAMIQVMRDLQGPAQRRAQERLDDALDRAAEISYDLAHVHEGDLKASQSHGSEHGPTTWRGTVAYGSRGARYEIQRAGDHSQFIDALTAMTEGEFERAIATGLFPW